MVSQPVHTASVFHHGMQKRFSDKDPLHYLIMLSVNLGIGDNDNSITFELAGDIEIPSGIVDARINETTFYGFEVGDVSQTVLEGRIISTTVEAVFGDVPISLQEMIQFVEDNGIPETKGVNLVKVERGSTECTRETFTADALVRVVINRLKQAAAKQTEFFKILEEYGLGFIMDEGQRKLIFINEPEEDEEGNQITFTGLITGSYKSKYNVHNRAGDFLVRKITGQNVGAEIDVPFEDGTKEPFIQLETQASNRNRNFALLAKRDELRNTSDMLSGLNFELNENIKPRHLFLRDDRGVEWLVEKANHKFNASGHSTTIDVRLYQVFTQPDEILIRIERHANREKESYLVPNVFLPKELNKNDSANIEDWTLEVLPPVGIHQTATDAGIIYDILDTPYVDDRVRAIIKAIDCPVPGTETYQWYRVLIDELFGGESISLIQGANRPSYTVSELDVGYLLECHMTYITADDHRVTDTMPGRTKRLVQMNQAGEAQLVFGDIDTVLPLGAIIGRMIAAFGSTAAFITGTSYTASFINIAGYAMRQGIPKWRALTIATSTIRTAPLRFIGPFAGIIVPLSVYSVFHAAAVIRALNISKADLRILVGDAVVVLVMKDSEGVISNRSSGISLEDGTVIYDDAVRVLWEYSTNQVVWTPITEEGAIMSRIHNFPAIMDYNDDTQVQLAEDGNYLVSALFPRKDLENTWIRATIMPYHDYLDGTPGTSFELHDIIGATGNPNPEIITAPILIPVDSTGGLSAVINPQEPVDGFQANNGEAVTLIIRAAEQARISGNILPVRIHVTRYNDANYTEIDDTFSDNHGQISSFPPISYVFQSADATIPGIDDTGKWFEFELEFVVGAYNFRTLPVRLDNPVRSI